MAEPPTIDWPAPASANPEPNTNPNHNLQAEPLSQVELQDQMTSPLFQTTLPGPLGNQLDTEMIDIAPSPTAHPPSAIPTSVPNRTATPTRNTNGQVETTPMPLKAAAHGAPARRYLNEKVTGVLLEGMKRLVVEQPEDPLRVLGEFLLQKSRELEGI